VAYFLRVTRNQRWKGATHLMNWFSYIALSDLLNVSILQLEELDHAVPPSRDDESLPIGSEAAHIFDRHTMLGNIHGLLTLHAVPPLNTSIRVGDVQYGRLLLHTPIHWLTNFFPANA
jgi:hypothetical protein